MRDIGFTTGSLYKSNIPFEDIIRLYCSLGASAIELSFAKPKELLEYQPSKDSIKNINTFNYVSIHAPWKEINYDSGDVCDKIIKKLEVLCDEINVKGIVLHPDTIKDFKILNDSGLLFLLENMDKRKDFGTHPNQFKELKDNYDFGFILDLQHVYEQDSSMQLAKEFIEVIGERLKHMHVSGCNESELHIPVHLSKNKDSITEILKLGIDVPIILEGILMGNVKGVIKKELEYVRGCKNN